MATSGAGARAGRARGALGTRGLLLAAFTVLAAAFAATFALQVLRLARMAHGIAELRDHQEEMHLALQLEEAVRSEYARQARVLAGEEAAGPAAAGRDTVAALVRKLSARVDEPQSSRWVEQIAAATRALDQRFAADVAAAAAGAQVRGSEEARYRLVFEIEENAYNLFAFLREESAVQSASVERLRRDSLRLAVGFAVAVPLFALAVGIYLARAIARPLAVLGDGAARIGRGDLRTRIALRGPGEFAALGAELNAMAESLQQHQERLVRSEKLASLGRLAAGIAHEINNPLQVMIGYLTLHRGRVAGELGTDLAHVEREAKRCQEIVEGLLQLSRPAVTAAPQVVDLREVSQEVADAIRVAMPDAPALHVAGAGHALGCPARFRQVIFNLVKNAAEAAGPAGKVEVEVGCDLDTTHVVVSDTGPGIPADRRERLFEPFFTTKATGTGLGLALARAIARSHGGDVDLEDAAVGARFSLRAPRRQEGAGT